MAQERKRAYPTIPVKHWWAIRNKFKQSLPTTVTPSYIVGFLNMKLESAKGNIIPALRDIGIIDAEGKTLDRARRWRIDDEYAKVCEEIRQEIYPQELRDALSGEGVVRADIQRWFGSNTTGGEEAVRQMAVFYELLNDADVSKAEEAKPKKLTGSLRSNPSSRQRTRTSNSNQSPNQPEPTPVVQQAPSAEAHPSHSKQKNPSLHIDVQIHISAEASADQIDQIFASMAKHLYKSE